ncbi:uncharacterized protein TNCV_3938111 [Trichonephila clavipes]|nr:uncharacterized protein TNCV_3938111 [Trichonephila clavipes]
MMEAGSSTRRVDRQVDRSDCVVKKEVLGPVDTSDVIYMNTRLKTPVTGQSLKGPPHHKVPFACLSTLNIISAVGILVVRASESRPEGLGLMPPNTHRVHTEYVLAKSVGPKSCGLSHERRDWRIFPSPSAQCRTCGGRDRWCHHLSFLRGISLS